MTEETATVEETAKTTEAAAAKTTEEDQRVPYERFDQVNKKAKAADDRAKAAEKRAADLEAEIAERESAGLPELEQLKKRLEKAEKDAEQRVSDAVDQAKAQAKAERLVIAAASRAGFDDPDDVFRFPEHVDVSLIEDSEDAEKAVKRLAKAKPKLLKDTEQHLPGKVLANGQPAPKGRAAGELDADTQVVVDGLKEFMKSRNK